MSLILKSRIYREELKNWLLNIALFFWAILATFFAMKNNHELLLIGIDENSTHLITSENDKLLQSELKSFLKNFLLNYYSYNEKSFSEKIDESSNLMSQSLWEKLKPSLTDLKDKLAKTNLSQTSEIESIDLINQNSIEAILLLKIDSKLSSKSVKLKVLLKFSPHKRTQENPWGYEITELSDALL